MLKFDKNNVDEEAFLEATFNEIDPKNIPDVIQTFNDSLDRDLREKRVIGIHNDGCDETMIICDNGEEIHADSETTMQEIIDELLYRTQTYWPSRSPN
jgi:hypothetical protein